MSGNILCEFYCLGLHKRLNSSRHHIHWLASKSDSVSQGKVQSQKLPILCRILPILVLSVIRSCCCIFSPSNSIHVGDCRKIGLYIRHILGRLWALKLSGSVEVKCSLPRGKSHGEDGTSKPFMSEWEVDIVFESNINFLDKIHLNFFNKNYCGNLI